MRFIAGGRLLEDSQPLVKCRLGNESFIHVSIGERAAQKLAGAPEKAGGTKAEAPGYGLRRQLLGISGSLDAGVVWGTSFFLATGTMLQLAWRARATFSTSTSQLLYIFIAVWVYLVFGHGLPSLGQVLFSGSSVDTDSDNGASPRVAVTPGPVEAAGQTGAGEATSPVAATAIPYETSTATEAVAMLRERR